MENAFLMIQLPEISAGVFLQTKPEAEFICNNFSSFNGNGKVGDIIFKPQSKQP